MSHAASASHGHHSADGKPVFDATSNHKYEVTEKEMTDAQKMSWKQYQLYRLTMKVDRRDSIYQALASSDYTNFEHAHQWLGSPYPVIEPFPFIVEAFVGIRWYEHLFGLFASTVYYQWVRSKPAIVYSSFNLVSSKAVWIFTVVVNEMIWAFRSVARLQGRIKNEHECYKFGILESPARLKEKAENWTKYRDYKNEWMKRFDYYVWGIRPGERYTFFSQCHFGHYPVHFNTKTDYPQRKNPFFLSTTPITAWRLDSQLGYFFAPGADTVLEQTKPETKYLFRGGMAA